MVVKDTFLFKTVTDGCEEANFMGISKYIYKTYLTSDNMYLPMSLAKRYGIHLSLFKEDSKILNLI